VLGALPTEIKSCSTRIFERGPKSAAAKDKLHGQRVRILIVRPRRINNENRAKIRAGGPTKISRKTKGHEREKPILLARYKNRGFDPAQEPRTSGQVK
jgi:hypothetical protein